MEKLRTWARQVERLATDAIARIAPWFAPIPTSYLVGRATVEHLHWPVWVGMVAAVIIESLGLATAETALELREYNQSRRKSDPRAPFALAVALVVVYLVVAIGLTVALDIAPALATYSPAIFPFLSLVGVTVLALRGDHQRRLAMIAQDRAERKTRRQVSRKVSGQVSGRVSQPVVRDVQESGSNVQNGVQNSVLDAVNISRRERKVQILDAIVDIYRDNPKAGATDIARQLGIGRSTVYTYNAELEQSGRIAKNGNGWIVKQ